MREVLVQVQEECSDDDYNQATTTKSMHPCSPLVINSILQGSLLQIYNNSKHSERLGNKKNVQQTTVKLHCHVGLL